MFLPFVTGYYLSYLYRTITALISDDITRDLGLTPADLGLLASMYFLAFGLFQLPLGVWLDRYGPAPVQALLLSIAAAGAILFAIAGDMATLLVARALIGLGVAGALMAGLKAIVLWFPADRVALANGWFVMVGGLGAVTATAPADALVDVLGWRGLFGLLAVFTTLSALMVLTLVPEASYAPPKGTNRISIIAIYRDARFWTLAPLSATLIGSAWALQGLWAAPWLADVAGYDRPAVVRTLFAMACSLSVGALLIGFAADRLRRHGIGAATLLATTAGFAVLAQVTLVLRWPVPPWLPWTVIAATGAATVLSYAILSDMVPKAITGRANGALNVLHVAMAFAIQAGIGVVIELWPMVDRRPPPIAYQTAFGINLTLQALALGWFVLASRAVRPMVYTAHSVATADTPPPIPYDAALAVWTDRVATARSEAIWWRWTALTSLALLAVLTATTAGQLSTESVVYVVTTAR